MGNASRRHMILTLCVGLAGVATPAAAELFSCEGAVKADARAVVSVSDTHIVVNGVPYRVESTDEIHSYGRLDPELADAIQTRYFPNRSLIVDRKNGRIVEFKDHELAFAEGNTVEWSCRAVKAWTDDSPPATDTP